MSENQSPKAAAPKESLIQRIKRVFGISRGVSIYDQPFTAPTMQMLHEDITLMPGLVASLMPAAAELCTARYRDGFTNQDVVAVAVDLAIRTIKAGNKAAENFYEAMQGKYVSPEVIESREQMATIEKDEAPVADEQPAEQPAGEAPKSALFDLTELPVEELPTSERVDHVDVAPLPDPAPSDKPRRRRGRAASAPAAIRTSHLLTPEEAHLWVSLKLSQLYYLASMNRVPHYRVGRLIFFDSKELVAWLRAGGAHGYTGEFLSEPVVVNHRKSDKPANHIYMA